MEKLISVILTIAMITTLAAYEMIQVTNIQY